MALVVDRDEVDAGWMPISKTRSYLDGDPICDWLNLYGAANGFLRDDDLSYGAIPETDFAAFMFRKGREFQAGVDKLIDAILREQGIEPAVDICCAPGDAATRSKYEATIQAIERGAPVLRQPAVWDSELGIYGAPDYLIRSDVLNRIVCDSLPDAYDHVPAHYLVLDVKFTTADLNSKGEIGNKGSAPAKKAQLALYNAALSTMQGYEPKRAFLLTRGWKLGKDSGRSCIERLAAFSIVQDQRGAPSIDWKGRGLEAIEWLKRLRREGANWTYMPPTVPELCPNMKESRDFPWRHAKKKIAEAQGELTLLWNVGMDMRRAVHERLGHIDWSDPRITAQSIADGGGRLWDANKGELSATGIRLEAMLAANRGGCEKIITSPDVKATCQPWCGAEEVEFFVDFETVNDLEDDFSALPERGGQTLIFMVGCGHYEGGEWRFKVFVADSLTPKSEFCILTEWFEHMEEVRLRLSPHIAAPKVFHWSPAETSSLTEAYASAASRHPQLPPPPNWFDFLNRVVKPSQTSDYIVVEGAMGFGLKAIGKALHRHRLIATDWQDGPTDGLGAMVGAWWCYEAANNQRVGVREVLTPERDGRPARHLMREIERYNEVDCKVMAETITLFRKLVSD